MVIKHSDLFVSDTNHIAYNKMFVELYPLQQHHFSVRLNTFVMGLGPT